MRVRLVSVEQGDRDNDRSTCQISSVKVFNRNARTHVWRVKSRQGLHMSVSDNRVDFKVHTSPINMEGGVTLNIFLVFRDVFSIFERRRREIGNISLIFDKTRIDISAYMRC